jgi:hypothetical protein
MEIEEESSFSGVDLYFMVTLRKGGGRPLIGPQYPFRGILDNGNDI